EARAASVPTVTVGLPHRFMKFNLWLVVTLVAMPLFVLFSGMTAAAGGFGVSGMWATIACVAAAGAFAARLARRHRPDRVAPPASSRRATAAGHATAGMVPAIGMTRHARSVVMRRERRPGAPGQQHAYLRAALVPPPRRAAHGAARRPATGRGRSPT